MFCVCVFFLGFSSSFVAYFRAQCAFAKCRARQWRQTLSFIRFVYVKFVEFVIRASNIYCFCCYTGKRDKSKHFQTFIAADDLSYIHKNSTIILPPLTTISRALYEHVIQYTFAYYFYCCAQKNIYFCCVFE